MTKGDNVTVASPMDPDDMLLCKIKPNAPLSTAAAAAVAAAVAALLHEIRMVMLHWP